MAAPAAFIELLRLIQNGDSVDEATINRILRTLDSNDRYLKSLMESMLSGSALYRRNVTTSADVVVGSPVYFHAASQEFRPGIAAGSVIEGALQTAASAQVWGICSKKHNGTSGDILLQGFAAVDISAALAPADPMDAGLYFLSGSVAGRMTTQEPPVSVPVLQYDGDGGVYVHTSFSDIYAQHHHYKVTLLCQTSGTRGSSGGRATISSPDTDMEGWLPADNAIFDGNAPEGAAFGYNISASPLANTWPPLPIDGVHAEWFDGDVLVPPLSVGLMQVDQYGIWWMTDCDAFIPWLTLEESTTTTTLPPNCPLSLPMTLTLWYTQPKFLSTNLVVSSLRPAAGSIITIRCLDVNSQNATTGNLEIDVDLNLLLATDTTTEGFVVLKGIGEDGKFTRGPVISALKAADTNVLLTSTDGADGDGYHRGQVTVGVVQNALGGELPIQNIKLLGAEEESYQDVLALGLPADRRSAFRGEVQVPYAIGSSPVNVGLRFWFLARAGGTLPAFTLTARVLPRPNTVGTLVTTDSAVTLTTPGTVLTEDQYIQITSANISAAAGSVIQFTLTRDDSGGGDGFNGDVHVIKQHGVIIS
jgi:hypothetical protein